MHKFVKSVFCFLKINSSQQAIELFKQTQPFETCKNESLLVFLIAEICHPQETDNAD